MSSKKANKLDDPTMHYVTLHGDQRTVDGEVRDTQDLATVFENHPRAGDVVQVLAGKYWPLIETQNENLEVVPRAIEIRGLRGTRDRPITIRGLGKQTILCGSNAAVPLYPDLPDRRHFAFFKLIDCEWVIIESFSVESCWPCFVYLEASRHITVRDIEAVDSLYLIFARGRLCHHLLIEDNDWSQDPSGAVWRHLDWVDVHHGDYRYLNGGLFGSEGITGSVVVRRNRVRDAYNVIRMVADRGDAREQTNLNVEIYENEFTRIRDNVVEPEGNAINWWVHHNRIENCHAWFSLDGVSGGYRYIFSNLGWFNDWPGQPKDDNKGGKVLKFAKRSLYNQDHPTFVFHNSWFLRIYVAKKGLTERFHHWGNAIRYCDPEGFEGAICQLRTGLVSDDFLGDGWQDSVFFDHDLCNRPFGDKLINNGQEENGTVDPEFQFVNPRDGDLRPALPDIPAAAPIVLKAGEDWPGSSDWSSASEGDNIKVGAWQDAELMRGPSFVFYDPGLEEIDYADEGGADEIYWRADHRSGISG